MNKIFLALFCCCFLLASFNISADENELTTEPSEAASPTIDSFTATLTQFGTWVKDPNYGMVWQPSIVITEPNWRPYCHGGHWLWTDNGWYWQSSYKWGCVFHYGRWFHHATLGWVWVPDTTWGPAWVDWRECDTHYGWAPLPPLCEFKVGIGFSFRGHVGFDLDFGLVEDDFCFVPCHSFLEIDLGIHCCGHKECHEIYGRSKSIKECYSNSNKKVVCGGVSRRQVINRTHTNASAKHKEPGREKTPVHSGQPKHSSPSGQPKHTERHSQLNHSL